MRSAGILSRDGRATADLTEFCSYGETPLLPIGAPDHGFKGFALSLLVEALTQALSGFGSEADDLRALSAFVIGRDR